MKRMVAFGAVATIVALLVGCGDSGSTSGASGQNSGAQERGTIPALATAAITAWRCS